MSVKKIYLIIEISGAYGDRLEKVVKAFTDPKKAEACVTELEDQERGYRDAATKCRECAGLDKTCPFYTKPAFDDEELCGSYEPWHDNEYFRIDEVDLEE